MSAKGAVLGVVGAVVGFLLPPGNVAGAVALGAAGYGAGAQMDAADKQVEAAKRNQEIQNAQANEIALRASENTKIIMQEAEVFKGDQVGAMVRGGVDIASQSSLVAMENSHAQYKRQAYLEERDANMRATAMRQQAQINVDAAKSMRTATQISAITGMVSAGAGAYANRVGGGSPSPSGGGSSYSGTALGGGSYMNAGAVA